jgi:NAD(P)-dependent dehydrogenase (short-subunit alcohol dehydrogenase family)
MEQKPTDLPGETQSYQPGSESDMSVKPEYINPDYQASGRLKDKVALITGGDSGIGRAVSVHYAKEGADVAIVYLDEDTDAEDTKRLVEQEGRRCILFKGDIKSSSFCKEAVEKTVAELGKLNILVNNAAVQFPTEDFQSIDDKQLDDTFRTNIFAHFHFASAALNHLHEGDTIINTTSVTAYRSSPHLIDYSSTKGAIVTFTRSLAKNLAEKKIRVNGVAPGPVWTPLIVSTFDKEKIESFGKDVPLGRAGQPSEIAPAYVFLASKDSSYITGQIIHVNGGEVVNG